MSKEKWIRMKKGEINEIEFCRRWDRFINFVEMYLFFWDRREQGKDEYSCGWRCRCLIRDVDMGFYVQEDGNFKQFIYDRFYFLCWEN